MCQPLHLVSGKDQQTKHTKILSVTEFTKYVKYTSKNTSKIYRESCKCYRIKSSGKGRGSTRESRDTILNNVVC